MALFSNLQNLLKGAASAAVPSGAGTGLGFTTNPVGVPFKKTLTVSDFSGIGDGDVTVTAGTYTTIGTYTVGAQRAATVGQGSIQNDPVNQGKIFIDLEDGTAADLDGWVRVVLANANETRTEVVLELRTERLSENPTDDTKWFHQPEFPLKVGEDSKILIQFKADGSGTKTVSATNSKIYLDITEYQ